MNEPVQSAPVFHLQKFWEFVRSVLPVDPGQTAVLFGAVLLLAIPHMGMWHAWLARLYRVSGGGAWSAVSIALHLPLYLLYAGGAVALWIALREVKEPEHWIRLRVGALVIGGIVIELALGWHFQNRYSQVPLFEGASVLHRQPIREIAARLPGFTFEVALFAWLLMLVAAGRLLNLKMTLPVRFPLMAGDVPGAAAGTARLIWSTLSLTSLMTMIVNLCSNFITLETALGRPGHGPKWLVNAEWQVLWAIGLALIVWFSCGDDRSATLSRSLQSPGVKWAALGVLFPLAVTSAVTLGGFLLYRMRDPSAYPADYAPDLSHHFPDFVWHDLILIVPALVEELAWRGYLQPKFIRRFGMYRGIFLVGIVWGAFHFPWDFSSRTGLFVLSSEVAGRLANAVATGFVFSWLVLRAKSVVPAAIAHCVMNGLYLVNWGGDSCWVIYGLWAVLAFLLFRYWPPEMDADIETGGTRGDELPGGVVTEIPA